MILELGFWPAGGGSWVVATTIRERSVGVCFEAALFLAQRVRV